jgi:hypothetical protein
VDDDGGLVLSAIVRDSPIAGYMPLKVIQKRFALCLRTHEAGRRH